MSSSHFAYLACQDAPAELCNAVGRAVEAISGGRFVVQHRQEPAKSARPNGDVEIALKIDGRGDGWIAAHLEWQSGPDGARSHGPSLELGVMDATLNQRMYDRFAESLVRADAAMTGLLAPENNVQPN